MGFLSKTGSNKPLGQLEDKPIPLKWEALAPGMELAPGEYTLDSDLVSRYIRAVTGEAGKNCNPEFVPPLAIAAYAMTGLGSALELPAGTIHAAQEVDFLRPVPVGSVIKSHGRVAQKVERGKLRMLTIELIAESEGGGQVLSGRATLILPA